jgi:hypothetical protein
MSEEDKKVVDTLLEDFKKQLNLVVDVRHLNASNILEAVTKGMHIAKDIKTTTNEQKKSLLLRALSSIVNDSDLSASAKEDLIWVIDEMGPNSIELFLIVAGKGLTSFKNSNCFKKFCCC